MKQWHICPHSWPTASSSAVVTADLPTAQCWKTFASSSFCHILAVIAWQHSSAVFTTSLSHRRLKPNTALSFQWKSDVSHSEHDFFTDSLHIPDTSPRWYMTLQPFYRSQQNCSKYHNTSGHLSVVGWRSGLCPSSLSMWLNSMSK